MGTIFLGYFVLSLPIYSYRQKQLPSYTGAHLKRKLIFNIKKSVLWLASHFNVIFYANMHTFKAR